MLQSKIARRYSTVIHSYDKFSLNKYIQADSGHWVNVTEDYKKQLLKDIYQFYLKVQNKRKVLRLDENTSIDKAFVLIAEELEAINCRYEVRLNETVQIGLALATPFNIGMLCLKPILDMRKKDKKFFEFLKLIIQNYDWCGHSVFDNYMMGGAEEMEEQALEECEADAKCNGEKLTFHNTYIFLKILKKIIQPFLKTLKEEFTIFKPSEIKKHCKNHPKWKEFIMDSIACFGKDGEYRLNDLGEMLSDDAKDSGYLGISDCFSWTWDYHQWDDISFTGVYEYHVQNSSGEWIEDPYAVADLNSETHKNIKTSYNRGMLITKPYMISYACFQPK
jgi:hypothetical protein